MILILMFLTIPVTIVSGKVFFSHKYRLETYVPAGNHAPGTFEQRGIGLHSQDVRVYTLTALTVILLENIAGDDRRLHFEFILELYYKIQKCAGN